MKNIVDKYIEEGLFILSKLISYDTVLDEYQPKSDAPFGIANQEALKFILDYASHDGFWFIMIKITPVI